ncbi:hypothetical protein BOA8489_04033 [Boseongicola aestuarii]|uniref:Uncharacterized protein n=1 Tax=Boseongicola aestuarii TaxID=1470561 RepID=A0A238J5A4_9RHOB|nr:hypothetical protein BOA8489_04033 [Boseongicola aestuarii]
MAQSNAEAIRAQAMDYLHGWFEGGAARMKRALSLESASL